MSFLLHTLVVLLVTWLHIASARSTPGRPLKRVAHPSTLSLEILPRHPYAHLAPDLNEKTLPLSSNTLRHDDSFRLIISAFDETFHLHLRPNDDLIHPSARVDYYTRLPDGREVLSHSEPLLRHEVKAYYGEVIAAHHSPTRMREDASRVYPHPHPAVLGWARLMVHHQGDATTKFTPVFEGTFSVQGVIYHIVTRDNYLRNKHDLDPALPDSSAPLDSTLVIWRDSDEMTAEDEHFMKTGSRPTEAVSVPQSCGHDRLQFNDPSQNPMFRSFGYGSPYSSWIEGLVEPAFGDSLLYRRDDAPTDNGGMGTDFRSSIGLIDGCPTTQRVLYMGVAADCVYVSRYGNKQNATTQILTNWNSASSLYKSTFNVSLGISEIQIRDPVCPSTPDPNFLWNVPCSSAELDARLSLFSKWRGDKGPDGTGLWHLMSGCPTGSEVGIAWLGTICQIAATGRSPTIVSGAAVSTSGRTEWQVVAHEIGHNFGAIHDCTGNCPASPSCCPFSSTVCPADGRFIMNPVAQSGEKNFSPCSIGNICSVMKGVPGGRVNTSCLLEPDQARQTISLQMCGNGIVEAGEDCDPGKGANSNCCDPETCKFKNDAKCDPASSSCCTQNCTFAPSTQVCRPSKDPKCDTAEFCTGNSSTCPPDIMTPNRQSCGDNLACASGFCTSVAQQCQTVGASLGLQRACPDHSDQSCQLSCQDPKSPNTCIQLNSLLIDGSPCGFGGTCKGGRCEAASILETAKAWYVSNLQISVPITVVVGLFCLAILYCFIRAIVRCGRRSRIQPAAIMPQTRVARHERLASHEALGHAHTARGESTSFTRAPPAAYGSHGNGEMRYNYATNNHWVDETRFNGPRRF